MLNCSLTRPRPYVYETIIKTRLALDSQTVSALPAQIDSSCVTQSTFEHAIRVMNTIVIVKYVNKNVLSTPSQLNVRYVFMT